jgi:uncharacterized protein (UPF0128 family)
MSDPKNTALWAVTTFCSKGQTNIEQTLTVAADDIDRAISVAKTMLDRVYEKVQVTRISQTEKTVWLDGRLFIHGVD